MDNSKQILKILNPPKPRKPKPESLFILPKGDMKLLKQDNKKKGKYKKKK